MDRRQDHDEGPSKDSPRLKEEAEFVRRFGEREGRRIAQQLRGGDPNDPHPFEGLETLAVPGHGAKDTTIFSTLAMRRVMEEDLSQAPDLFHPRLAEYLIGLGWRKP